MWSAAFQLSVSFFLHLQSEFCEFPVELQNTLVWKQHLQVICSSFVFSVNELRKVIRGKCTQFYSLFFSLNFFYLFLPLNFSYLQYLQSTFILSIEVIKTGTVWSQLLLHQIIRFRLHFSKSCGKFRWASKSRLL